METKMTDGKTSKTYGDSISEQVERNKGYFKTLQEVGHKDPAGYVKTIVVMDEFVAKEVRKETEEWLEGKGARQVFISDEDRAMQVNTEIRPEANVISDRRK